MSIRALRTLISIHRYGSFRAAAEAEFLTPAAISQQMRNLEKSLNLILFDRSLRSPKLTATGLALVDKAEQIVAAYDNLATDISGDDDVSGELLLGAVPTTLTGLVPLALSQLKTLHPGVHVRILPGLSNQLLLQISRGQIHAAVISKPEVLRGPLKFTQIADEKMVLLAADNHEELTSIELLKSRPFIRFNRDAVVGKLIEAWLQKNNIVVNDAMELDGLEAISSMVAAELGISIVPQQCIPESDQFSLKKISLGSNAPHRILGLVSREDSPKINVIKAVQTALLKAVSIGKFAPE